MEDALVIISGASSGIGLALARAVPFPARILDVSRRGAAELEHLRADLASPEGWQATAALFERELEAFAGSRVVFAHCAGTLTPMGFSGEVEAEAYRRNVLLNSAAPQILGDAFLRALRHSQAPAQLLLISSGAAHTTYEGWTSYCAGKAAVEQWARTAGAEQRRRGDRCRILAVAPGVVATAMQEEIRRSAERDFPTLADFVEMHESGSLRAADEVAAELWALLEEDLPNGTALDLREHRGAQ